MMHAIRWQFEKRDPKRGVGRVPRITPERRNLEPPPGTLGKPKRGFDLLNRGDTSGLHAAAAGAVSVHMPYLASLNSSCVYKRTLRRTQRFGLRTMSDLKQKFDASTVAVMRQALNEVVTDHRFLMRKSVTPLEVAEHILQQAALGVRDLNRLKSSALEKMGYRCVSVPPRLAW